MKAVILAGGLGSRLSEETSLKPKPLLEVGGYPILLHIMHMYAKHGVKEFIILVGYKGYLIKEFFLSYMNHVQDMTVDLQSGGVVYHSNFRTRPDWKVSIIDTGEATMTGGRLLRVRHLLERESHFALTYGDGVSDLDISQLEKFHLRSGQVGTVTAVRPLGRFGALELSGDTVTRFVEKPLGDGAYINGGFFIFKPQIFDYMADMSDSCVFEQEPLQRLATDSQLNAYTHNGFWQCMDTLRDKLYLEELCKKNMAPWIPGGGIEK